MDLGIHLGDFLQNVHAAFARLRDVLLEVSAVVPEGAVSCLQLSLEPTELLLSALRRYLGCGMPASRDLGELVQVLAQLVRRLGSSLVQLDGLVDGGLKTPHDTNNTLNRMCTLS